MCTDVKVLSKCVGTQMCHRSVYFYYILQGHSVHMCCGRGMCCEVTTTLYEIKTDIFILHNFFMMKQYSTHCGTICIQN